MPFAVSQVIYYGVAYTQTKELHKKELHTFTTPQKQFKMHNGVY